MPSSMVRNHLKLTPDGIALRQSFARCCKLIFAVITGRAMRNTASAQVTQKDA